MRKRFALGLLTMTSLVAFAQHGVTVTPDEANRRVDVTIDGQPFTSYIWPTTLKKPVLYPLIDSEGVTVTRGYPLMPRANERVDHPHHAGLWFNYGNVNGFDFWNNSDAIKPEQREKMGSITEGKILSAKSGAKSGELTVTSQWITGKGQHILDQTTRYVFSGSKEKRTVDMTVTLKAVEDVVFNDDKEGVLGMRVASWLESPNEKSGIFMDAAGNPTKTAGASADATGVYLTSEGVTGDAVWATRGRWCLLSGHNPEGKQATIAILDHPGNPGYPTYWHARGYGLFAANPLGRSVFDAKQPAYKFSIAKGASATFHYRIEIYDHTTEAAQINHDADAFAAE